MSSILVFAGSSSRNSINKQLAVYASTLLKNATVKLIDLNDFPIPIFSVDLENENGIPEKVKEFNQLLADCDGVILSLAEHNASYSAVFKNLFDWISRTEKECWKNKPMLLMATSPGGRGGMSVLNAATDRFPRQGGNIVATFSLPFFEKHFVDGIIIDEALNNTLFHAVNELEMAL